MAGEFLAQSGDLFLGNGTAGISPLLSLISEDVGNLLVTQAFPGLHDRAAELLSLHRDRPLQTFHHDHGGATGAAVGNFRTGKRRITLALRPESACLMADRTIRHKNFLATLRRGKFRCLLLATATGARPV